MRTISERRKNDWKHIIREYKKIKEDSPKYAARLTKNGEELHRLCKIRVSNSVHNRRNCNWCRQSWERQLKRAKDRQIEFEKTISRELNNEDYSEQIS
jgi:hypothetical protein